MKKLVVMLLSMIMVVSLTACGNKPAEEVYENQAPAESQTVSDQAAAAETEETPAATEEAAEETAVEEVASVFPLTLTDKYGHEIVIEEAPQTYISMSPELTEIIYALGAGDGLIGRSSYCNYPEEAASVQDYGSLFDLNVESIVAAQPDIVFLSSMASEELVNNLMAQELTVIAMDKDKSLEGTFSYMAAIAQILGKEAEGAVIVEDLQSRIAAVEAKVADLEKPTVYYVVWAGGGSDSTATGDTFIHGMLTVAGGDNVAKEGTGWKYNVETLVEQDPYILFCGDSHGSKENIIGLEGYKDLTAVAEDRLYPVNSDMMNRQGPRIADAIETLAALMHPEAFQE